MANLVKFLSKAGVVFAVLCLFSSPLFSAPYAKPDLLAPIAQNGLIGQYRIPFWPEWKQYSESPREYLKLKSYLKYVFQNYATGLSTQNLLADAQTEPTSQLYWIYGNYAYKNNFGNTQYLQFHPLSERDSDVPLHSRLMMAAVFTDTGLPQDNREGVLFLLGLKWYLLRPKERPSEMEYLKKYGRPMPEDYGTFAQVVREFVGRYYGQSATNLVVEELTFSKNTLFGQSPSRGKLSLDKIR